jgi:hypothetical protein
MIHNKSTARAVRLSFIVTDFLITLRVQMKDSDSIDKPLATFDPDFPKAKTEGDYAHGLGKAGASLIPGVSGVLTELYSMFISSPLEKRREAWFEDFARGFVALQAKVDNLCIQDLARNDSFLTVFMHVTQVAARNQPLR